MNATVASGNAQDDVVFAKEPESAPVVTPP